MSEVKLLSDPTNYAIVQLPGRKFPGVVFQGDSLDSMIAELEDAARTDDPNAQRLIINDVLSRLRAVQARYEAVLKQVGIALPYSRS